MRSFEVGIPVRSDPHGLTSLEGDDVDIDVYLTEDDVEDLNQGLSITTATPNGEEIAVRPYTRVAE